MAAAAASSSSGPVFPDVYFDCSTDVYFDYSTDAAQWHGITDTERKSVHRWLDHNRAYVVRELAKRDVRDTASGSDARFYYDWLKPHCPPYLLSDMSDAKMVHLMREVYGDDVYGAMFVIGCYWPHPSGDIAWYEAMRSRKPLLSKKGAFTSHWPINAFWLRVGNRQPTNKVWLNVDKVAAAKLQAEGKRTADDFIVYMRERYPERFYRIDDKYHKVYDTFVETSAQLFSVGDAAAVVRILVQSLDLGQKVHNGIWLSGNAWDGFTEHTQIGLNSKTTGLNMLPSFDFILARLSPKMLASVTELFVQPDKAALREEIQSTYLAHRDIRQDDWPRCIKVDIPPEYVGFVVRAWFDDAKMAFLGQPAVRDSPYMRFYRQGLHRLNRSGVFAVSQVANAQGKLVAAPNVGDNVMSLIRSFLSGGIPQEYERQRVPAAERVQRTLAAVGAAGARPKASRPPHAVVAEPPAKEAKTEDVDPGGEWGTYEGVLMDDID
jgi:hypothetical protein